MVADSLTDAKLAIGDLRQGESKHCLTLVREAKEPTEFLERRGVFSRAPRPDLILLDLQLPKLDGRDLLTVVRNDSELKTIPVVILTASKAHEDIVRSELLQVDGYLLKPVDVTEFVRLVRQLRHFWHADVILPQSLV